MTLNVNTNSAALAALTALNQTTDTLNTVNNQVSTGFAVGSSKDNPRSSRSPRPSAPTSRRCRR